MSQRRQVAQQMQQTPAREQGPERAQGGWSLGAPSVRGQVQQGVESQKLFGFPL